MKKIVLIAAIDNNLVIGKDNELMYHIKDDMKHFKKITTNHTVVMGSKTYDSIGHALPNRENIVISSNRPESDFPNCKVWRSIDKKFFNEDKIYYIIGGASIYKQCIDFADELELTLIFPNHSYYDFEKDKKSLKFFPNISDEIWNFNFLDNDEIETKYDVENNLDYAFVTISKIKK